MPPISQRFSPPTNPDIFEEMCLHLLRNHWSRPGLEIFGKRGERQYGIDILDIGGQTPIYAAQCKLKEEHKSLPPSEIRDEIDEAKRFKPPLGKYAILITAKVSVQSQRYVREINQAHKAAGLFEVELITWERLCSLLQKYLDVQEQFYGDLLPGQARSIETQLVALNNGVHSLTARSEGDEIDSQINDARDCIVKREFQQATFLLNRIRRNSEEKLSSYQRFRVLSNLAAAALGSNKPEIAAKFFLDAIQWQPDNEQGRINEVLAYLLVGDLKSCHAKATHLRSEFSASARLAAMWLMSAPKETPLAKLEAGVNSVLQTDPEVCAALGRRALMALAFDKSLQYANSAHRSAEKWAQPYLIKAQAILGNALQIQFGLRGDRGPQAAAFLEAEDACTSALEAARDDKDVQTQKMALVLRVDLRLLQGKKDAAVKDASEAAGLDPGDPQVMLALSQTHLASGRTDEGISVLESAYTLSRDPNVAFLYGRALHNRGRGNDVANAINVLRGVALQDLRPELRATFATQTFQCMATSKDWVAAETYLVENSEFLSSFVVRAIRGYLALYQDRQAEAERYALEAKSLSTTDEAPDSKEYLARLLMLVGRPNDALPLWQELFDNETPSFDFGNLLNCAAKLHRHDLVMKVCDQLHARGVSEWQLTEFEVSYLEKYDVETAIERLQEFLGLNSNHKLAKLRLSMVGLGLNRPDLISGKLEDVPSIHDLPLHYALAAVQVMRYGGSPKEALDYSYRFLRENFNAVEAHKAMIASMLPGSAEPDIPPTCDVVARDSAVCYREIPNGNETWVVLEDTARPNGDFEEIALTTPRAAELLNKKVGDTVVLAKGSLQDRTVTILQIVPKYVRRYQDSMGEMQLRFGAASTVESFQISATADTDEKRGLEAILASVERRAEAVAGLREAYSNLPTSLHWFGSCFGKTAYAALIGLAEERGQKIKCCFGTPEERQQALQALQAAKAVVVDITALATLRLLRLEEILSSTKFQFIISERTWITLQEMLVNARMFSATGGTLFFKDGKHVMYEQSAEEKEERNREEEQFLSFLGKTTSIRSKPDVAALEPHKRESLVKFLGNYGAESIVLASDPEYVLWTDDLIQAQMAAQEFGVNRVWTQLVLGSLTDAGLLTPTAYTEATAQLIGMEYVATLFDSSSMLAALRLGEWSFENTPAAQVLMVFSEPTADLQQLVRIFVEFALKLYREPLLPEIKCAATRALLDVFAKRPSSVPLLESFRQVSSRLFGINQIGKSQFEDCFDSWLAQRDKPLIYVR